jgi:hypothetical protein
METPERRKRELVISNLLCLPVDRTVPHLCHTID